MENREKTIRIQLWLILVLAGWFAVNGVAQQRSKDKGQSRNAADKTAPRKRTKSKNNKKRRPFKLTPAREKTALSFVRKHHRELEELLVYLKEKKAGAYKRAIRDLWRADQRLTSIKKRSEARYKSELKLWKLDSRAKVLAARYVMSGKESVGQQLRDILRERSEVRRDTLAEYRKRLKKRLDRTQAQFNKLTRQLDKLNGNADKDVERRFKALTRQTKRRKGRNRTVKVKTKTKTRAKD